VTVSSGVDLFRAFCGNLADLRDMAAADGHVGFEQLTAKTIAMGAARITRLGYRP